MVEGRVTFSTGVPVFAAVTYRLVCESTRGTGPEKKTDRSTVAVETILIGAVLDAPGTTTENFNFCYDLNNWSDKKTGVWGAAAKAADFAQNIMGNKAQDEFYVEITGKPRGAWIEPTDRMRVIVTAAP
jgi:hypothetical protein